MLFASMAESWRGWSGEKTWEDLESTVVFTARADATGHISITVELHGPDFDSRLRTVLRYDAGQLEGMAQRIIALLG